MCQFFSKIVGHEQDKIQHCVKNFNHDNDFFYQFRPNSFGLIQKKYFHVVLENTIPRKGGQRENASAISFFPPFIDRRKKYQVQ